MPFRFALAPLLRLRQSVERQRILRLREASLHVARAKEDIRQLDQFLAASAEADQERLRAGRPAADLHFATMTRENLGRVREEMLAQLGKLELMRQEAASQYQLAYREREVLEALRERQHRDYVQEQTRRQQRTLDATHLIQRWRNPNG
jgi:flagellar export protein FliJ